MDGDQTAKTFEQGANSVTKGGTDLAEGIHESVNQIVRFSPSPQPLSRSLLSPTHTNYLSVPY